MSSNTVFRSTMHLFCSDLNLKWLTGWSDQCRMQRLIHIWLRHCDIIFETSRNRFVFLMDHTQCCITVLDIIHNNTDCKQIVDLIQGFVLVYHFLVNTEKMFCPSHNRSLDTRVLQTGLHIIHQSVDIRISGRFPDSNFFYQIIIRFRLQILQ